MNISEKRRKELENKVCIQQLKKALKHKVIERELDMTDKTIDEYCSELDLVYRQIGVKHDQELTLVQCLQWKDKFKDHYSRKALAKKIVVLNAYLHFVTESPKERPIAQIKNITREKLPVELPREQIMDMIEFAENKGKYTEAIMIFTAFITASRKTVLHEIGLPDIDRQKNTVTLRKCKGDLDLIVPLAETDMQRIIDYIDNHRPKPILGHEKYLFLNKKGKRVHDEKLRKSLEYCARGIGIKVKVTPHTMRHSRIKDLRRQGYEWEEIMTITGHKDITSLAIYIQKEQFDRVQDKLNGTEKQYTEQQNQTPEMKKEIELLKLKLQLAEKEKEIAEKEKQNLQMQIQLNNHEVHQISLGADHKGYV